MPPFAPLWRDPSLRLTATLMLVQGAMICSFAPYVSVLAVREFGLRDAGFSLLLVASTVISVAAAVLAGIRADQTADRRSIALFSGLVVAIGAALMTFGPSRISFVLAHGLLFPLSTLFSQLFAQARLAAAAYPPATRDGILAIMRALFALPFVIVLPLWSVAFQQGATLLAVYPFVLTLAAIGLFLTLHYWAKPGAERFHDRPSGLSWRQSLAELADLSLAGRVLALAFVDSGGAVFRAVLALILTATPGRVAGDAGVYAGLVAGLEVPFMLLVPLILPYVRRPTLILIGAAIYAVQFAGLPFVAGSPALWLLLIPGAVGGAITLTVPIAYLQDLMADRPGVGASLMTLQWIGGNLIAALCFALGTALSGYTLVALLGAGVSVLGAAALYLVDRAKG